MIINPYRYAGSAAFSPADIANLALWFDANDISTLWQDDAHTTAVTTNNDPVGAWQNKASGGWYVIQVNTSQKPTYKTGVQNSLPGVRGDGGDALRYASPGFTSDRYVSVFAVVNSEVSDGGPFWTTANISNTSKLLFWCSRGAGKPLADVVISGSTVSISLISQDDTATFRQITMIRNDTSAEAWKNGTSQGTSTPSTGNTINNSCRLFTNSNGANPLTGHICELIAYEAVLSTTDRQAVEAYLKAKWGTP